MRTTIIRKILVVMIILAPLVSYPGCKKQAKCGCGKDLLFTLEKELANVYWTTGNSISFTTLSNPYATYNFCNPGEMFPKMTDYKSGDILEVSGFAYWDCTYLQQQSNSSYQSYYKVYQIEVTDISVDPYGKK